MLIFTTQSVVFLILLVLSGFMFQKLLKPLSNYTAALLFGKKKVQLLIAHVLFNFLSEIGVALICFCN